MEDFFLRQVANMRYKFCLRHTFPCYINGQLHLINIRMVIGLLRTYRAIFTT
jgi:hypothetical protein